MQYTRPFTCLMQNMRQMSSSFAGSAQQAALLQLKFQELEDASAKQTTEILSLKEAHSKEVEELKIQLTQTIDERIHLANQLEQSKKSNITMKDKYQALKYEEKGIISNLSYVISSYKHLSCLL